jgi:hypothetical protein
VGGSRLETYTGWCWCRLLGSMCHFWI